MKHRTKLMIAACAGVAALVVAWNTFIRSDCFIYVPIVTNRTMELVEDRSLLTAAHLDHVEVVLKNYGEFSERLGPTRLRISPWLAFDRDLLWNYTTKAQARELQRSGVSGYNPGLGSEPEQHANRLR